MQKEMLARLGQLEDPYLEKDLATLKAIKRLDVSAKEVRMEIVLGYPHDTIKDVLLETITDCIADLVGKRRVRIDLTTHIDAHVGRPGMKPVPQIKNIIAVASGKGGVGKSTVAVNLALGLALEGAEVGLLDADIYGPSQPMMLGTIGTRPVLKDKLLQPIVKHGIQSMSIGYLIEDDAAMMWRGPMLGKALEQLVYETEWAPMDYLIVDLPPGTGDVQLTLCQKIPVSAALMVTTPQDLALLDVRRACEMFMKLKVPILGVVENMSYYRCQQCGHEETIFGAGTQGGHKLAQQYGFYFIGEIPLDSQIHEYTDSGSPPVIKLPEGINAKVFQRIARLTAARLALQNKDYSRRFPKIVVQ